MTPPGLARLGVSRVPVPVPFAEAGGSANVYVIEEEGGGLALFDAGIGTAEGEAALLAGFAALGRSLAEVRRIFVSHGHVDHYGYARAAQEASGAPVFCHPRDHDKLTWRTLEPERLERHRAWLGRLGAPADLLAEVPRFAARTDRFARPLLRVEALEAGATLRFARFEAQVLHLPGHTPGLVCLWDALHRVLFSDDHLLETISPNPLIDLEGGDAPRHRALCEYLRSARRVRDLPAELVAPGHGAPFSGHARLVDLLLSFYEKRQQKILELLAPRPLTAAEVAPLVFPRARRSQLYLVLSEVVGNLEVLEEAGRVRREESGGVIRFAAAG